MTSVDWTAFFCDAGISSAEAKTYTAAFVQNNIKSDLIQHLDKSLLQDMGITPLGDIMRIILNAKKGNLAKYITCKDGPKLSNKTEAENVKIVDENEIEDVNIEHLSQKEDSETEVGVSSDAHNVRETFNKKNEKVFSCTKCNYSAKIISSVMKHVAWYRDDKWRLQSQTLQSRKRGGETSDAGLDAKTCKDQTLLYPDISMAALKHSSSQDNANNESQVEKEHGDKSTSQKKSIDTSSVSAYIEVKFDKENGKLFCCTICSLTVSNRKALIGHIRKVHFGLQIFSCDQCPYTSNLKGNLKQHRQRKGHTGERDYRCFHCEFATGTIAELKGHMQSKHDGKIPNISLRPMSPVKESEQTDEPMSPVKDSELIDDNATEYMSMDEAPVNNYDLSQELTNDDGVRDNEMPNINEKHKVPLQAINVNVANVGENSRNGKRKGKPKGENNIMYCEFCSYKTVQTTRLWKHAQKVHSQTIRIIHRND